MVFKSSGTRVYSVADRQHLKAERQSNQTLLVSKDVELSPAGLESKLVDMHGHWYTHEPDLDRFAPGYFVFQIV